MQDKFILMWAKVNLKKVAVTSAILIKHFSYIFFTFVQKKKFSTAPIGFFCKRLQKQF